MTQPSPDTSLAPDRNASLRLFQFSVGALMATAVWFILQANGDISMRLMMGLGVLFLAATPALLWARLRRPWFPVFEISCLTYITFYAVPLLNDHPELRFYPADVVSEGALLVFVFLGMANLGFAVVRNPARAPYWSTASLLPDKFLGLVPFGLTLNTAYLYINTFTELIPVSVEGVFRALFFGVGTICLFILGRRWGLGQLERKEINTLVINLTLQTIILFSHLYLIGGVSMLALTLIAYVSAKRRIPWLVIAVILPLIALLHVGKPEMRSLYWRGGKSLPTVTELPSFFHEWVTRSLDQNRVPEAERLNSNIFERASLIQMLCLAVDRVPSLKPYLEGESYLDIPAQIVPRFLWPDKPSGLHSNVRLALYFNLVTIENAYDVSIAFGIIAEAYVNFGFVGVALLGFILGAAYRRISQLSIGAPTFSSLGIFLILLTAWSFQIELVMATWIVSLLQACVVCIGVPLAYWRFANA